jgi:hypothetical protein
MADEPERGDKADDADAKAGASEPKADEPKTASKDDEPKAASKDDEPKADEAAVDEAEADEAKEDRTEEAKAEAGHSGDGHGEPPRIDQPGATRPPAAWGLPFVRIDEKWTKFETWLCAGALILEILALTLWVALKGLSTPPDGAKAGVVFRAIFGATMLGMLGYFALRKKSTTLRRVGAISGVLLGVVLAKSWAKVGVDWSSNVLNWYQQASTLTLLGGLRGVGTRLTLLLALLGGSLATAAGRHITIDLATRFLKPWQRLPVTIAGWFGASAICFAAAWGFFDHIAIEDFGSKAEATAGEKIGTVAHGLGENFFILRKQIALDFKSLPHVMKGEAYADWFTGSDYNAWIDGAGFVDRYGKEKAEALKIPEDARRAPMVVIPEKGEPRGALTHAANLVFPIGLLIIALRFILLAILAISGHKNIEAEAHLELGTRREDDPKETA